MKNPNYAAQIVSTMQAQNRPAWQIVGYLEAILTGIQCAAEDQRTSPELILEDLSTSATYIQSNP
jgi:hypothetical protein